MSVGDATLVAELDRLAPTLLAEGRPARLLDRSEDLGRLDLRGHPWARLLVACVSWDAAPGTAGPWREAQWALQSFRRRHDCRGEAFACYVLGCWTLTQGRLIRAGRWFSRCRLLAGQDAPGCEFTLVHEGLGAYAEGRLDRAIAMTEEAVALARVHGKPRAEATALVNLGFFQLWAGEFAVALSALEEAEDAFAEVADPYDRFEAPLCYGARGVLWALRGDDRRAESEFARALCSAQEIGDGWYEAIVRALRAEFTAHLDARRGCTDARWALCELERRNERWWKTWAAQAAGVAAREAGMAVAARTAFRSVLADCQNPLEKARSQLLLAETLLTNGEADEASSLLHAALATFDAAGCRYWATRCRLDLARTDSAAGAWLRGARRCDISDIAYRRLFTCGEELSMTGFGLGSIQRAGRPAPFHSHNAERALFLLALAVTGGMHVEELAEALWPDASADRARLLGRVRTLLWDARRGLGPHAWRLERRGPHISFDMADVTFDVPELRRLARAALASGDGEAATQLARRLRRPFLTRWAYDDWVLAEESGNRQLADRLELLATHLGGAAGARRPKLTT